jgi:hypothetical protein
MNARPNCAHCRKIVRTVGIRGVVGSQFVFQESEEGTVCGGGHAADSDRRFDHRPDRNVGRCKKKVDFMINDADVLESYYYCAACAISVQSTFRV